jgi:ATP-dependent protease ClpP protease subunit
MNILTFPIIILIYKLKSFNIFLRGDLLKAVINFTGNINQKSIIEFLASLGKIVRREDVDHVDIFIDSTGGNTDLSVYCYNQIKAYSIFLEDEKISIYNTANCNSAAFTMFLGVDKENRKSVNNAYFMFHQNKMSYEGTKTVSEINALQQQAKIMNENLIKIISENTEIEDVQNSFFEEYFFNAETALEQGVINEIVDVLPSGHGVFIYIHGYQNGDATFVSSGY